MSGGRPKDNGKKVGRKKKLSKSKSKSMKKANKANPRHQPEIRTSKRLHEVKIAENPDFWKDIEPPSRQGHVLSQDQIDAAVRTIYMMKLANENLYIFERASKYLDISDKTLHSLWNDNIRRGKVPITRRTVKRAVRMKLVGLEWFEPIREYIENVRLHEQRCVELPDIQKFLCEKHDISIGRSRLRYRMC